MGQKGLREFQRRKIERRQLDEETSEPQRVSQFDQSKLSMRWAGGHPQREMQSDCRKPLGQAKEAAFCFGVNEELSKLGDQEVTEKRCQLFSS